MIVLVGLPRSGKSSYAMKIKDRSDIVVNLDQMRKIVYGQEFNQMMDYVAIKANQYMLEYLLTNHHNVIVDATNTRTHVRKELVELAKKYNYRVEAHFMNTPPDVCMIRAIRTDRDYLTDVIHRQIGYFDANGFASNAEGFDDIKIIGKGDAEWRLELSK